MDEKRIRALQSRVIQPTMVLKKYKTIDQVAFWLFMFLFVADYHLWEDNWVEAAGFTALEILTYMLVSYLNYFLLMPKLFGRKQYLLFWLSALIMIGLMVLGIRFSGLEYLLYEAEGVRNIISMTLNYTLFFLLSTLYWYYKEWQKEREQQLTLKNEKLETELKFLKSQISPHFLFNTLNNIYTLAYQKHDNAAPMVSKLSKIMRYILYECDAERVPLEKEIETLQHFIELHLLRKPRSQNIDFYAEGSFKNLKIAPLLLLNFVENAFKHSDIDKNEKAWIKVHCEIQKSKQFSFLVENSKEPWAVPVDHSGIGLENVKRQLEMNYEKFKLDIEDEKTLFKVELVLNLEV